MKLSLLWMPLALLVALLSLAATQLGQWDVSQSMLWHTLWSLDDSASIGVVMHLTWWPRLVTALLAGACLGLAGTLMQQVLRNPLASPSSAGGRKRSQFGADACHSLCPLAADLVERHGGHVWWCAYHAGGVHIGMATRFIAHGGGNRRLDFKSLLRRAKHRVAADESRSATRHDGMGRRLDGANRLAQCASFIAACRGGGIDDPCLTKTAQRVEPFR